MTLKLGKQPARPRAKDIHLGEVVKAGVSLPQASVGFGHYNVFPADGWGMLGNDRHGDCVWAGADHETMMVNAMNGREVKFGAQDALADYAAVTGFNPSTGAGDNGTDVHQALDYRRATGVVDAVGARHRIGAYVSLEPGDWAQMLEALLVFDFVGIGFAFPDYAMDEFDAGKAWRYRAGQPAPTEGHYVPVVGRPHSWTIDVVTWGRVQGMGRKFFEAYCTAPHHRVLTADLRWVPAGELQVGDRLVGFEEHRASYGGRRYRECVVLRSEPAMAEVWNVELSTGEVLTVTPDHRWLLMGHGSGATWAETRYMRGRRMRSIHARRVHREESRAITRLARLLPVWETSNAYEDGWLAGFLDGEGSLSLESGASASGARTRITFGQNRGAVLERALDSLARLGMLSSVRVQIRETTRGGGGVATRPVEYANISISGRRADRLRLLGMVRPSRLLAAFDPDHVGRLEQYERVSVESIRPAGRQEIAQVTTSTGTLIVDGYPMHNCDEAYGILTPETLNGEGRTPEGLDIAELQAALAGLG